MFQGAEYIKGVDWEFKLLSALYEVMWRFVSHGSGEFPPKRRTSENSFGSQTRTTLIPSTYVDTDICYICRYLRTLVQYTAQYIPKYLL